MGNALGTTRCARLPPHIRWLTRPCCSGAKNCICTKADKPHSSHIWRLLCWQKFMAIECPLSCGICTHSCNDTDVSCGAWATAGECEANPDAMLRICPTSCGLCTPECKDGNKECAAWGAAGECNTNPEFMIRTCPVTCEACKATCKDVQADCPGWTADGECFKNPGYMCATASRAETCRSLGTDDPRVRDAGTRSAPRAAACVRASSAPTKTRRNARSGPMRASA